MTYHTFHGCMPSFEITCTNFVYKIPKFKGTSWDRMARRMKLLNSQLGQKKKISYSPMIVLQFVNFLPRSVDSSSQLAIKKMKFATLLATLPIFRATNGKFSFFLIKKMELISCRRKVNFYLLPFLSQQILRVKLLHY